MSKYCIEDGIIKPELLKKNVELAETDYDKAMYLIDCRAAWLYHMNGWEDEIINLYLEVLNIEKKRWESKKEIENRLIEVQSKPKTVTKDKNDGPDTLSELFEEISKYQFVMDLLVKKEFCEPGTYKWIDETGGNKYVDFNHLII